MRNICTPFFTSGPADQDVRLWSHHAANLAVDARYELRRRGHSKSNRAVESRRIGRFPGAAER